MRPAWVVLFACCALHGLAVPARADDAPEARAQALFERGLQLSAEERWADARAAFLESVRLTPRASAYFNLAVSSLELGLGRAALDALDRFDGLADPVKQADYRQRAATLRVQAHARVGTLELSIAPAHARLEIDGDAEPATGGTRVVLLDPGSHVVRLSADGREPRSIEVTLRARETAHQRIELSPALVVSPAKIDLAAHRAPAPPAPALTQRPAVDDEADRSSSLWSKPLTWIVIGAVVAAGATTAVLIATRDDTKAYGGSAHFTF